MNQAVANRRTEKAVGQLKPVPNPPESSEGKQSASEKKEANLAAAPPTSSAEKTKPPRPPDALLTMDEISLYLGVSVRTIKQWVANGTIPYRKLGKKRGRVRFSNNEVDEWSKPKLKP